jgi:GT2 family glycosyltransferase
MAARADILILSWNRVEDTIAAIVSAHQQEGVEKTIQVVDQGSEPANLARLREAVREMPETHLDEVGSNLGVAAGRNRAARGGSAPYLVALDSDAVFADSHTVARAVAHLDTASELCAVGFRITNFYSRENDATSWDYPSRHGPTERFSTTRVIGAGHAIRRSTFETVGGYDERLFFCGEEGDLCYRMLNTGLRIEYLPECEILHKVSPEHRVEWGRGRFFYTVRNNLYSGYKFGTPLPRQLLALGAFAVRGARNGIPLEAPRAAWAAWGMCRRFKASPEDKRFYALAPDTVRYIADCEPARRDSFLQKVARQFRRLPS